MRIVLDTNVSVSGLLWSGLPSQIIQLVENGELQAIGSEAILAEMARTLDKPKLQKRLSQIEIGADAVMLAIRQVLVIVHTAPIQIANLRDPQDGIIIATAISGQARAIITGDQDLLVLATVQGIPILSPQDFLSNT
jgi:uncharacterized protein